MNIRLVNPDLGGKATDATIVSLPPVSKAVFPLQWHSCSLTPGCAASLFLYSDVVSWRFTGRAFDLIVSIVSIVRQNSLTSDVPYREYPRACLPLSFSPGIMFPSMRSAEGLLCMSAGAIARAYNPPCPLRLCNFFCTLPAKHHCNLLVLLTHLSLSITN